MIEKTLLGVEYLIGATLGCIPVFCVIAAIAIDAYA